MKKNAAIAALLALAIAPFTPSLAQTPDFSAKPIRLILGAPAGGSTDGVARPLAQLMGEALKANVIVDNRPGALSLIAAEAAMAAEPDGFTVLFGFPGYTSAPFVAKDFRFDLREATPIALFGHTPLVVMTGGGTGINTVADLVQRAKTDPAKNNYASSEGTTRIYVELLNSLTGMTGTHIPYKGGAQLAGDVASGLVQYGFGGAGSSMALHKAGKLKILAVANATRLPALPDVPTMDEAGVKGFDLRAWAGLLGPKGMKEDVRAALEKATRAAAENPTFVQRMQQMGAVAEYRDGKGLRQQIDTELALAKKTAEAARIQPE
jgi:tripartite-type tricarboxylate transporter receptor subunit TctC